MLILRGRFGHETRGWKNVINHLDIESIIIKVYLNISVNTSLFMETHKYHNICLHLFTVYLHKNSQ